MDAIGDVLEYHARTRISALNNAQTAKAIQKFDVV